MVTLTSTSTKFFAFAFSALVAFGSLDSLALGFQHQDQVMRVVTLPAVTVVGHRADSMLDTIQVAGKREDNKTL